MFSPRMTIFAWPFLATDEDVLRSFILATNQAMSAENAFQVAGFPWKKLAVRCKNKSFNPHTNPKRVVLKSSKDHGKSSPHKTSSWRWHEWGEHQVRAKTQKADPFTHPKKETSNTTICDFQLSISYHSFTKRSETARAPFLSAGQKGHRVKQAFQREGGELSTGWRSEGKFRAQSMHEDQVKSSSFPPRTSM